MLNQENGTIGDQEEIIHHDQLQIDVPDEHAEEEVATALSCPHADWPRVDAAHFLFPFLISSLLCPEIFQTAYRSR